MKKIFVNFFKNLWEELAPWIAFSAFAGVFATVSYFVLSACKFDSSEASENGAFGVIIISGGITILIIGAFGYVMQFFNYLKNHLKNHLKK